MDKPSSLLVTTAAAAVLLLLAAAVAVRAAGRSDESGRPPGVAAEQWRPITEDLGIALEPGAVVVKVEDRSPGDPIQVVLREAAPYREGTLWTRVGEDWTVVSLATPARDELRVGRLPGR